MPVRPPLVDKFVLGTDIEGYSGRTTREHGEVQRSLDRILTEAAETVGLDRAGWHREPGGDGEMCALPGGTDLVTVVRGFVTELDTLLTDHNQDHAEALRIRLRVAMHIDVLSDGPLGVTGPAFVVLSRLLGSEPLRAALAGAPAANLALMLSEPVYRKAVLSELGGLRPAQFRRVEVDIPAKGFHETAYLRHMPGPSPENAPQTKKTTGPQPQGSHDYVQAGGPAVVGNAIGGDLVFGDKVFGDKYVGGGVQPLVPVRTSEAAKLGWQGGADVTVGPHTFLLDDAYLSERFSADYSIAMREARALRRGGPSTAYAWLRQVEVLEPSRGNERAPAALTEERDLLDRLRGIPGVPRQCAFEARPVGSRTTLALTWPSSRLGPRPTLSLGPPNGYQIYRLFRRLASLCDILAEMHKLGVSHRALSSEAVVVLDGDGVALRDLGLAAHDPRAAEGTVAYPAPEQRSRRQKPPGMRTDSYQVAALAYDLLIGRAPDPGPPLSVGWDIPDLPAEVTHHLDAALANDPSVRPPVSALASVFRSAWRER